MKIWLHKLNWTGFPRGIESIEFQNWFSRPWKVLKLAKMCITIEKVWNSKWNGNSKRRNRILLKANQFIIYAVWKIEREVMVLNFFNLVLKRYWKSMENDFQKCVGTLIGVKFSILVLFHSVFHNAFSCGSVFWNDNHVTYIFVCAGKLLKLEWITSDLNEN